MAGDLVLDGDGLARLGGELTSQTDAISGSASTAEYALRAAAAAVVSPRLVRAMGAFAAQITRLPAAIGDYVAVLREAVDAVAVAFGNADTALAGGVPGAAGASLGAGLAAGAR